MLRGRRAMDDSVTHLCQGTTSTDREGWMIPGWNHPIADRVGEVSDEKWEYSCSF